MVPLRRTLIMLINAYATQYHEYHQEYIRSDASLVPCVLFHVYHHDHVHEVSPPQMPVPLKHMYNANILWAEFTIFVPTYAPL